MTDTTRSYCKGKGWPGSAASRSAAGLVSAMQAQCTQLLLAPVGRDSMAAWKACGKGGQWAGLAGAALHSVWAPTCEDGYRPCHQTLRRRAGRLTVI